MYKVCSDGCRVISPSWLLLSVVGLIMHSLGVIVYFVSECLLLGDGKLCCQSIDKVVSFGRLLGSAITFVVVVSLVHKAITLKFMVSGDVYLGPVKLRKNHVIASSDKKKNLTSSFFCYELVVDGGYIKLWRIFYRKRDLDALLRSM